MDSAFGFAFPIEFDWISTLVDCNYHMIKDGIKRKVSPDGTLIQDFEVDHTWALKYPIRIESQMGEDRWGDPELIEEVANTLSDYLGYRIDYGEEKAFGVIHAKAGKILIPAKYDNVRMVSDRLFEVEDLHDRTSMFIDLEGRIIQTSRK